MKRSSLGHFKIVEELGRGGMGVVYRAVDTHLDRLVALKMLPSELVTDPEPRDRLFREARSAAAVNHPNIAAIFEVGELDDTVYIAMEYVAGETLRVRLERRGKLPTSEVIELASQLASALTSAHAAGIVHRDLKPENLAYSDRLLKILDFGLAKQIVCSNTFEEAVDASGAVTWSVDEDPGQLVGTLEYMSPEQLRGQLVDGRSDIFSLGVILFELLTGEPPFRGNSTAELIAAILTDSPPAIDQLRADVPIPLAKIVERMLNKDPVLRLSSADALARNLSNLLPARTNRASRQQPKLCFCGRSERLPLCDGSHREESWTCDAGQTTSPYGFVAPHRFANLARKLAAEFQATTWLDGEPQPAAATLVILIDGTDLELALEAAADPGQRVIIITFGVQSSLLFRLFPGRSIIDMAGVDPLEAFRKISALLDQEHAIDQPSTGQEPIRTLRSGFLSHAVADEPTLLPIKQILETFYGADLFMCADSVDPGSLWQEQISAALRRQERFIYLLSRASLASHFCSFEVGVAVALGKPMSIISIDGSRPPDFVRQLSTIDLQRINQQRPWLDLDDLLLEALLESLS